MYILLYFIYNLCMESTINNQDITIMNSCMTHKIHTTYSVNNAIQNNCSDKPVKSGRCHGGPPDRNDKARTGAERERMRKITVLRSRFPDKSEMSETSYYRECIPGFTSR